jgi:molybdopterin-containing oxidoreductase family membrane subunit
MIENALAGNRKYWLWISALLVLIVIGALFYMRQLTYGLGVTGLSRDVTWGLYISQFTFFVGVAASAVMVVLPYYLHDYKQFGKITILGELLAVAAVTMCMLFIFVDMGQPARVMNVLLHPTPHSMMFWDMVSLSGYLLLNGVVAFTTLSSDRKGVATPHWVKPFIYISIPWAVSIHTVTAFLYSGLAARPFWMTAVLAPRFLASAFASGPALLILLILVLRRTTGYDPGAAALGKLKTIMTYAATISVFFVLMELFTAFYSGIPEHREHFEFLYAGLDGQSGLVPWMWVSVILMVAALSMLYSPRTRVGNQVLAASCVCIFISLWIEKGMGLIVGGLVPSALGSVAKYQPTMPEWGIVIGIWAIGSLMVTVFYKITVGVRSIS